MSNYEGKPAVFDIETDGFLYKLTKIHVLSYQTGDMERPVSIYDYKEIGHFINTAGVLIGHNIIRFDIPAIKKVLGIERHVDLVDTLPLSRNLFPERQKHGLESWGDDAGVAKPPVPDWDNVTKADATFRCESDVRINTYLLKEIQKKLKGLYLV